MQDIARRLTEAEQTGREVKFGTVRGWKSRGVLPAPLPQTIAGSPVWEWDHGAIGGSRGQRGGVHSGAGAPDHTRASRSRASTGRSQEANRPQAGHRTLALPRVAVLDGSERQDDAT